MIREAIEAFAVESGLGRVGFTTAEPFPEAEAAMVERVESGFLAGLDWFTAERARLSCRPRDLLPWARSIVAVAVPYLAPAPVPGCLPAAEPRGALSRYAWGGDYHPAIRARLQRLALFLESQTGRRIEARAFVDTGRLAERAVARRAGLGWPGKSTNLIVHPYGTWIFLGALVTDLDLEPDSPAEGGCGRCDLCRQRCPTGALVAPYTVDARRCLSYLTIEHRGPLPRGLRPLLGNRIFGCDACQEVCPHNRHARAAGGPSISPREDAEREPLLLPLLRLSETEFRHRFAGTAVLRARRPGLLRNVAVALGNLGDRGVARFLEEALADPEPLVRGHAAWALGRLGGRVARSALERARVRESDPAGLEEIEAALVDVGS